MRLGTRGSRLALCQAETVSALLHENGIEAEIVKIVTSGDKGNREVLGAFVGELELALIDGRIDLALHCLKDLPTGERDELVIAAYLHREDPRDALLSQHTGLGALPESAIVGTGSLRRTAQLKSICSDLRFSRLVGNVDTRLRKLHDGEYDAIVLAKAGLDRLGLMPEALGLHITPFEPNQIVPAAGQATLVLQANVGSEAASRAAVLDHSDTRAASVAERACLGSFGTGCSLPIGAYAAVSGQTIHISAVVLGATGSPKLTAEASGPAAEAFKLGQAIAQDLIGRGAKEILEEAGVR